MQPTLTHLALQVADVPAIIDFYGRYCGLRLIHERKDPEGDGHVVWLAEPGREADFILVVMAGGAGEPQAEGDYAHLGFAVSSRAEVDRLAELARSEGRLVWPPRQEPFPVGYYCGVRDPDGKMVEFSYGQPLGPGAEAITGGGWAD